MPAAQVNTALSSDNPTVAAAQPSHASLSSIAGATEVGGRLLRKLSMQPQASIVASTVRRHVGWSPLVACTQVVRTSKVEAVHPGPARHGVSCGRASPGWLPSREATHGVSVRAPQCAACVYIWQCTAIHTASVCIAWCHASQSFVRSFRWKRRESIIVNEICCHVSSGYGRRQWCTCIEGEAGGECESASESPI